MMSIRTFFCFGLSIPFYSNKRGMDRPEQKRAWINQDVIDGPRMYQHFSGYTWVPELLNGLIKLLLKK